MTEGSRATSRDKVLQTSWELFKRFGYQAVGVDRIADESGVAKMTLYRHFSSKDDLIVEVLLLEDARIRRWLREQTGPWEDPRRKLRALFEALERRMSDPLCPGCLFQMAAGEFPDPGHPAHRTAKDHKRRLYRMLQSWVDASGFKDEAKPANQLYRLMEGAWAAARLRHEFSTTFGLAEAATILIEGGLYAQALSEATRASSTKSD